MLGRDATRNAVSIEPAKGKWNEDYLKGYGDRVLRKNRNNVGMLTLLAYGTSWSAEPSKQRPRKPGEGLERWRRFTVFRRGHSERSTYGPMAKMRVSKCSCKNAPHGVGHELENTGLAFHCSTFQVWNVGQEVDDASP